MKRCFVISPIGQEGSSIRSHADDVFRFIIEPAMHKLDIEPVRSDQLKEAGRISEQMFREIFQADVCVAVLSGFNPNVFYELAVAQCAARPVIILIETGSDLPFDVQDLRCIHYSTEPISRLVDGYYADQVLAQVAEIAERGWVVPGLFEQFDSTLELKTEQQVRRLIEGARPKPLTAGVDRAYAHPDDEQRQILIVTGDIMSLTSDTAIDVIVSPENTEMQLGPYYGSSLSSSLRLLDAQRSAGGRVLRDSLDEALRSQIDESDIVLPMTPGAVIATPTDRLGELGVKRVFHVAAFQGAPGEGYRMRDELIDDCVRNAFNRFGELAEREALESILIPMIGSFQTRLDHDEVARRVLKPAVTKMKQIPACRRTYLLAWIESQRFALIQAAEEMGLVEASASGEPA